MEKKAVLRQFLTVSSNVEIPEKCILKIYLDLMVLPNIWNE